MSKVSVIIPAYNQGHYLAQAISSVQTQSYDDIEIIIVDDGSTDDTADVVKRLSDPRIYYVYQDNRGLSAARNTGIRHSTGRYITYLDSDDLFLPRKIELLVEALENDPGLGFVAGQAIPIDGQGNQIGMKFKTAIPEDGKQLLLGNPLHVGSVILSLSWQQKVGFFDESLRSYEDWDMWLRLALAGCRMGWLDQPVSLYRFHADQMTRIGRQMTEATFFVLDKHLNDPDLPKEWRELKNLAYSNAYLRAAAQAYLAKDFDLAQEYLLQAARLNPDLITGESDLLASQFAAWTTLPKISDPVTFLEDIYNNLPNGMAELRKRRRRDLARAAMEMAFMRYDEGEMLPTRSFIRRAIRYQPGWLANRGALSILVRSHLTISK